MPEYVKSWWYLTYLSEEYAVDDEVAAVPRYGEGANGVVCVKPAVAILFPRKALKSSTVEATYHCTKEI